MTEALLVSNVLLWVVVVALGLVVAALVRQIGVLHERVAPAGALAIRQGPEVGEPAPELQLPDAQAVRGSVRLGGEDAAGRMTLLFFLSPTCPVCKTLLPTLNRVAREQADHVRIVYASDGDAREHERFRREHGLGEAEYVLSTDLGLHYQVAKLPYAVLIDAAGRIRAKGLVNTREHLESLFEADRLGVASIQDYLARESDADSTRLRVSGNGAAR